MAEMAGPRSLDNAKEWMRAKLEARVHPLALTNVEDTREVIEGLTGLDGASWAAAWGAKGDHFAAKAAEAEAADKTDAARDAWYQAYGFYFLGRFPCPNHPDKLASYEKEVAAYQAFGKYTFPKIDVVTVPFDGREGEGTEITFYVRKPEGVKKPPVVVMWGGVDAWKEEMTILTEDLARRGLATVALDNVGTGQSPIKAGPDGERQFAPVLDWVEASGEFDAKRIALVGRSFGGHWATKLAHQQPDRFRAAVNWGGGVHYMFQPDWIEKSRYPDSYLMELVETRSRMLGASNDQEYIDGFKQLSLLDQGLLDGPCAPMLLINGKNDTQCPIADIELLTEHGDPKAVRLFAGRGHMGFGPGTVDTIVNWLNARLA
ncbi:alpha/beta hydrolase family protein [Pseudooceanicola nitratireducens]|uniref:alpha/beta hydrolase family protein n=1 Tax=Pseudooceanicola nitratireducens TaxID=517719 RepID=UPI0023F2A7D9|nr:alpha/beta fold hydrolase [Pseudooceanicola nitratireducens]